MDVAVGNQDPSAAADDPAEPAGNAALAGRPFLAFLRTEDQSRRRRTSMGSWKAEKTAWWLTHVGGSADITDVDVAEHLGPGAPAPSSRCRFVPCTGR